MSSSRFNLRIFWLLLADAAILFGGMILAMYLRFGFAGSGYELDAKNGWMKIALVTAFCL